MKNKIKFLAYYLPQYYPIAENDEWWGKGFTEWTNVTKAKPLFRGHYQPILPADLGYYDLRVSEVQQAQSELALKYGIDGFIYYQYWFGNGKMLLEKPAEAMLKNKSITIPFCFCWANETWRGIWHGLENASVLIEQTYQGIDGYKAYFNYLLPFFKDERYIRIDNKPMFYVYRLDAIPDFDTFVNTFNSLAVENGFDGIYLIATGNINSINFTERSEVYGVVGLDIFTSIRYGQRRLFNAKSILGRIESKIKYKLGYIDNQGRRLKPLIIDYEKKTSQFVNNFTTKKYIPCVFPNWDNTARSGKRAMIFKNSTPKNWEAHLEKTVLELIKNNENPPFIIVKSWNEWAEGNYLEPDLKFGHQFLNALKNVKIKHITNDIS